MKLKREFKQLGYMAFCDTFISASCLNLLSRGRITSPLQRHVNRIGVKDSPRCPLCDDDAGEMDLSHIQKCQSLTDNMDIANNQDKLWNLSNYVGLEGGKRGGTVV